jgi:hypothetical protein
MNAEKKIRTFKTWCAKENHFFTQMLGDGDTFTNSEVLLTHIVILIGLPVIFASQAIIENLSW